MNEERWVPLWQRSHNTDRSEIREAQAAAGAISAQAVFVGVLAPFSVTSLDFVHVKHHQPRV